MSDDILSVDLDAVRGRKGKSLPTGSRIGNKATIARTVSRSRRYPEVMVKIVGSGRSKQNKRSIQNMQNVRGTVDYIGRSGGVFLEDENGHQYIGEKARDDALYDWRDIPESGKVRREALHIIFSMPSGTPRDEVTQAVRAFAAKEWDDYRYLFAQHDDEAHAHVHVVLNMNPIRGAKRLNPRKADLQRWRERFAEQLLARGIDANATPRAARGVTKRGKLQAIVAMDQRARAANNPQLAANVTKSAVLAARREVDGDPHTKVPRDRLDAVREAVVGEYVHAASIFKAGDESDKRLAHEIEQFVQNLPPIVTRHDEMVQRLEKVKAREGPEQGRAVEPQGPER